LRPFAEPAAPIKLGVRLSTPDQEIAALEVEIAQLEMKFVRQGELLATIRDKRLFEAAGHRSFKSYVKQKWGMTEGVAGHLMKASRVVRTLIAAGYGMGSLPPSYSLFSEWAKLDENEIAVLWGEFIGQYPSPEVVQARDFIRDYLATNKPPKPRTKASISVSVEVDTVIAELAQRRGVAKGVVVQKMLDRLFDD
jgi:hypothetical protein